MKKLRLYLCSMLVMLCGTLGLLAGCSDPLANLKVTLDGELLTFSEDVYHLTLVKDANDATLAEATVEAIVEGVSGDVLDGVEWKYDSYFLSIVPSEENGNIAVISGLKPTTNGTIVTVCSVESEKIFAKLIVDVEVKPTKASLAANMASFGIPIGQAYSLNPQELFSFEPANATIPEYTFSFNGELKKSNEVFTLSTRPASGTIDIVAYPTNRNAYTEEELTALTVEMNDVRVYTALTEENTYISAMTNNEEVKQLEVVKNIPSNNELSLMVQVPSGEQVDISVRDPSGIINKNILLPAVKNRVISITGIEVLDELTSIYFDIKVSGVSDARVITKELKLRVVDMPQSVVINGSDATTDYTLRVFNKYDGVIEGAGLEINLSPHSNIYNNVRLAVVASDVDSLANMQKLLINGKVFEGTYDTKSGEVLYLRSTGGTGAILIDVIASDTEGTGITVSRRLVVELKQSITSIVVKENILDSTDTLNLQTGTSRNSYEIVDFDVVPADDDLKKTVTATIQNPAIATVLQNEYGIPTVKAVKAGRTKLILTPENGEILEIEVRVLSELNGFTITLGDDAQEGMAILGPYNMNRVAIGGIWYNMLDYVFLATNARIHLKANYYPLGAVSMVTGLKVTPRIDAGDIPSASIYQESYASLELNARERGSLTFEIEISYTRLKTGSGKSVEVETGKITREFSVRVFEPITSIEVNQTDVELLANVIGGTQSYYDLKRNETKLNVSVYPSSAEVQATNAEWAKTKDDKNVIKMRTDTGIDVNGNIVSGASIQIAAGNVLPTQKRLSAEITVSVRDINGIVHSKVVRITVTQIERVSKILIDQYGDQNNEGLYFEPYKNESFELNITVSPSSATNKNVEYIIFDAEKLEDYTGSVDSNIIKHDTGRVDDRNQKIYEYYRIIERNEIDNPTSRECYTASVTLNAETGTYSVSGKNAGYAFLYIVAQDVLPVDVESITDLKRVSILQSPSNTSSVRRIPIVVADGKTMPFRLYTAEDVASIGTTDIGLTSNYYLMNSIDMSTYLNKNPNWTPIGTPSKPFSGSITSMGCDTGDGVAQSIVGWTLERTLNETNPMSSKSHLLYYGIFGAVSGTISHINFSFNSYTINQSTSRGDSAENQNYFYGLLAGRLMTSNGQSGVIENVSVRCSRVTYHGTNLSGNVNEWWFNLGAIGVVDAEARVNNFTSNITANISSTVLPVNFGAMVAVNKGLIGESTSAEYTNYAVANVAIKASTGTSIIPTKSTIGGAVGKNEASIYGVSADGKLALSSAQKLIVGGVVAINNGTLTRALSTSIIEAKGTAGGVVGTSSGSIDNVIFEIFSSSTTNRGLSGSGVLGGIAGIMSGGSLSWAMVQGYNGSEDLPNIVGEGIVGGLVGSVTGAISINQAFVNVGLVGSGEALGGLVGKANADVVITNAYVRGVVAGETTNIGVLLGNRVSGTFTTNSVYAELSQENNLQASGLGTITAGSAKTIIWTNGASGYASEGNLIYLDKSATQNAPTALNTYTNYGFDAQIWNTADSINSGYPYLMKDGEGFVRIIITGLDITTKAFDVITTATTNGSSTSTLNSILNMVDASGNVDNKKLIMSYQKDMTEIALSSLFEFGSSPVLDSRDVRINVSSSATSVVEVYSGSTFDDCYIRVVGTGTAIITFVSRQDVAVRDYVQICVINGFEEFKLYEGSNDGTLIKNATPTQAVRIKNGSATQGYVEYLVNGEVQASVSGGVKFGFTSTTELNADEIALNLGEDWQVEEINNNGATSYLYYQYLSGLNKFTFTATNFAQNPISLTVAPFIKVNFYELDDNGNVVATNNNIILDITADELKLNFDAVIYKGANSIAIGLGNGTSLYAGETISSAVTVNTDNYDELDAIDKHISYAISVEGSDEYIIDSRDGTMSGDLRINFGNMEYNEAQNRLIIPFSISLSALLRENFSTATTYTITFWANDTYGMYIENMETTLTWTYLPQKVNLITLAHYSDAINNGSILKQAGQLPTNTMIAGQYGLLMVKVAPDYASYDRIEIVSEATNGEYVAFDQRALLMNGDEAEYWSWQRGVEIIENGLALYKVSNLIGDSASLTGSFDGSYYIRTLISKAHATGSQFTVTVKIYQGNRIYKQSLTMTVHQQDTLSLGYANYNSDINRAYVASGTGYIDPTTPTQNQNELLVSVGSTFADYDLTVSATGTYTRAPRIVNIDGRYFLNTGDVAVGETITVTLIGQQNMSGYINEIKRELVFNVVDFYISSIDANLLNGAQQSATLRYAYVKGQTYDLRIFEGATLENLDKIGAITFDTTNDALRQKIIDTINALNGIGTDRYLGWRALLPVGENGEYEWEQVTFKDYADNEWLDGNYRLYNRKSGEIFNGYTIEGNGVSSSSRLYYNMAFDYVNGEFKLIQTAEMQNTSRGHTTRDITIEFYQMTSQEHPQPIYSERDLLNMEEGIDYILLNDITLTTAWTPITTEIRSLNGNGYSITMPARFESIAGENYGLFSVVTANMVVKNLTVKFSSEGLTLPSEVSALDTLNFGVITAVNEGTIYNCHVQGWHDIQGSRGVAIPAPTDTSANFYIGGIAGTNSPTGAISNSRVTYLNITGFGLLAGVASNNAGTISSSFFSGGIITNVASTTGTNVATAGLVVENQSNATIFGSYTGGGFTDYVDGSVVVDSSLENVRDGSIVSNVTAAGFVYRNLGNISDCYSAMDIEAIEASGFVYTNTTIATITRCYSVSVLTSPESGGTTSVSMPFIGADSSQAGNNNFNPDGITNCYFLNKGFSKEALEREEAIGLTLDQILGNSGSNVFTSFLFSRDGTDGSEFTGVWVFVNEENQYFTPNRFTSNIGTTTQAQTNFGPKLVSASLIATPRMYLDNENTSVNPDTGVVEYHYTKAFTAHFTKLNNTIFGTDYAYDPVAVTTATQFNEAFDVNSTSVNKVYLDTSGAIVSNPTTTSGVIVKIIDDIRLARNIDQNDISINTALLSPTTIYAGIFEGNGFTYSNLNLTINDESTTRYGLFGTISSIKDMNIIGTVKNFRIGVNAVSCSQVDYVGALAGVVEDANIFNIAVTGATSRVIGNNAVGGVVGKICGTSRAHNISANVGVTANYKAETSKLYNADLLRAYGSMSEANSINSMGLAGGVFGLADLTQFDEVSTTTKTDEAVLSYITSSGNASIVGKSVGGIAGALGVHTVLNYATKLIDTNTTLRGSVFAGGLVGQNNGVIRYSTVSYNDDVQTALDNAHTGQNPTTNADGNEIIVNDTVFEGGYNTIGTGGLVGLNIGLVSSGWTSGSIYYSSSSLRVRNANGTYLGGIAGVAYGGEFRAVFATGGIVGGRTSYLGGIVGMISNFSEDKYIISSISNPFNAYISTTTTLDYCVALNNYLATDYNYYLELSKAYELSLAGAQGGLVGYCYDANMIYTTHTVDSGDPSQPYYQLINSINYFVNEINNRVVQNTVTAPQTGDSTIILNAVGNYYDIGGSNIATGHTRGYILNNYDEIFGGWDKYSISQNNNTPQIDVQEFTGDTIYINSIADYQQMYWHPDKNYILTKNLDFLEANTPAAPIGSESSPFTGTFDGNGYVIKNLPMAMTGATNAGMFGATDGATIKNVRIVNLYISTNLSEGVYAYVGGLIGVARNTTVSQISITRDDSVIGAYHGIDTRANNVGGMFGRIYATDDGISTIMDCYVDVDINAKDNVYRDMTNVDAFVGGFAGTVTGNVAISNAYAEGNLTMTNSTSATSAISHYVGGAFGKTNGATINGVVSDMQVKVDNIQRAVYLGGLVGASEGSTISNVDSASDLNLTLFDLKAVSRASNGFLVGGLVGFSYGDTISTFVASGDITLNGSYGVDVSTAVDGTVHALGGVIGVAEGSVIQSGYSIVSIFNNTTFKNVDMTAYQGSVMSTVSVDRHLALTSSDRLNRGVNSGTILKSVGTNEGLVRPSGSANVYARISMDEWSNQTPAISRYQALYNTTTGASKRNPILISSLSNFNAMGQNSGTYNYYLQNIPSLSGIDITTARTLYGWYNAGGNTIVVDYDILDYSTIQELNKTHYGIFGTLGEVSGKGSIFSGATIRATISAKLAIGANFGVAVGEIGTNSILSNVYVTGKIALGVNSGHLNLGALAGVNYGQLTGCGADVAIELHGIVTDSGVETAGGSANVGGLVGLTNGNDTKPVFVNSYVIGSITNHNTNSSIMLGGLVGSCQNGVSTTFNNLNCYTNVTITDNAGTATTGVVVAQRTGIANANGVYYERANIVDVDTNFTAFTSSGQRESSSLALGSAYKLTAGRNYGLPHASYLANTALTRTGDGSEDNPYHIRNAGDLIWALTSTTENHYILTSDIDFAFMTKCYSKSASFVGHLDGDGYAIANISATLVGNIAGSVKRVALLGATVTPILADSVSGSVSEIYTDSTSGAIVTSGNITNSLSLGATFGDSATYCFTSNPTAFDGMDGSIWVFTGKTDGANNLYDLEAFVPRVGESATFGISVDMTNISSLAQLERALEYTNDHVGEYSINIPSDTMNLGNCALIMSENVAIDCAEFTNGLIIRNVANASTFTTLKNAGVVLENSNLFGSANSKFTDGTILTLENVEAHSLTSGALVVGICENTLTLNVVLTNVKISAEAGTTFYAITNSIAVQSTVNATITNIRTAGVNALVGTNNGIFNITASGLSGDMTSMVIINNGTISGLDGGEVSANLTNAKAFIASTNDGNISGLVLNESTISGTNASTIAQTNSGDVSITIAGDIVLTGSGLSGLFNTYNAGTLAIVLNANIEISGSTDALCVSGADLIDTTNITGSGSITSGGVTLFPTA